MNTKRTNNEAIENFQNNSKRYKMGFVILLILFVIFVSMALYHGNYYYKER